MLRVGVCWSGSSYTKPTNRPSACSSVPQSVPQDRKSPAITYAATTWNGEGGIRTHGADNRTTVFETAPSQIGFGGRVNSRWLQVQDLNLYLNFQERMITADSLLRYQRSLHRSISKLFYAHPCLRTWWNW